MLIAMLTGITEVHALLVLFGVNAAMILFGEAGYLRSLTGLGSLSTS